MRTTRLLTISHSILSIQGVNTQTAHIPTHPGHTHPGEGEYSSPGHPPSSEQTWYQRYPPATHPRKDMGQEIPTPCEQTHTCENISFSQLGLRMVKMLT